MDACIHELLQRNLQEVFGEGDETRRRAAIAELYMEDCVLYAPPGVFVGHAERLPAGALQGDRHGAPPGGGLRVVFVSGS